MPKYAELDQAGHVIGIVSSDDALTDDPRSLVEIADGVTFPPAPTGACIAALDGGVIVWQDARTLADAQAQAWQRVKVAREAAIAACGATAVGTFDTSPESLANITSVSLMLVVNPAVSSVRFTLADNTRPTISRGDFITAAQTIGAAVQAIYDQADTLRQTIAACETNAAADAVSWPN